MESKSHLKLKNSNNRKKMQCRGSELTRASYVEVNFRLQEPTTITPRKGMMASPVKTVIETSIILYLLKNIPILTESSTTSADTAKDCSLSNHKCYYTRPLTSQINTFTAPGKDVRGPIPELAI